MSLDSVGHESKDSIGQIHYLSGPSSSGKTTTTREKAAAGWLRIEADVEINAVEITFLSKDFRDDLAYIKKHLNADSTISQGEAARNLMDVVYGGKPPDIKPENQKDFDQVRQKLVTYIRHEDRGDDIKNAQQIHLFEEAIRLAKLGNNVIIDEVPLVNEHGSSHEIKVDSKSPNLWCFRDFKIEQQLKFVPIDILIRNLTKRNSKPEDRRDMRAVLERQYSKQFVAASSQPSNQEVLCHVQVSSLKKSIERAVKIDFFDINSAHSFNYDGNGDIDEAIEKRMKAFVEEMNDPNMETKDNDDYLKLLAERKLEYPDLQKNIDEFTQKILANMQVPKDDTEFDLTYLSKTGIQPTIIRDPDKR